MELNVFVTSVSTGFAKPGDVSYKFMGLVGEEGKKI